MLSSACSFPLTLPTKHLWPFCILKSEEHFSPVSIKTIAEFPFFSDKGTKNILVLILNEQNSGVVTLSIFEELDVTLTVFIQFVKTSPIANASVTRKLRNEVVEHFFG
jgi:hypothetical protein